MTFISYAQNFEDVMLWRALKHIENGFYIDIGAQDPVVDSVSLAFYEHGWRGIHIEPVLDYVNQLASARPDETVIPAAVGSGSGLLTFFTFPDTGLSTTDPLIAQRHKKNGFQCVETKVPVISLDELLETNSGRPVHWLKLDVEGAEKNVLTSWKKSNIKPWILVIESTRPLTQEQSHQEWEQLVICHEYTFVYFDGLNRYYVSAEHPELKSAFAIGPNIFDGFRFYSASQTWVVDSNDCLTSKTQPESQLYRCVKKIEGLSHDLSERNSNIEVLKNNIREHKEQIERLLKELSVSKQLAHHWWLEYDKLRVLRMELEPFKDALTAVHESRSWRITAPLRAIKTVLVHRIWRSVKIRLKITLNKLAVYVNRHPVLRSMALRVVHRMPRVRLLLVRIIRPASVKDNAPAEAQHMSCHAQRVYEILRTELMHSCGEKR